MAGDQAGSEGAVFAWNFAGVEFDEGRWELAVNGTSVALERKPLEVLAHLLRHADEVVTKDELLEAVWPGRIVVEGALTNAIGKLRKAIGNEEQSVIVTVPRVGYRLTGKVDRRQVKRLPPQSRLNAGDAVPRRPNWKLETRLDAAIETEVWLARHAKTGEARVFKFSLDGARLGGLKREATVSRLLKAGLGEREDIVRVIDWDFEDAPYFLECDYGGKDLLAWVEIHSDLGKVPLAERLDWMRRIADTVDAAHALGVLHKDLKPANILLAEHGEGWRPRIADFGSSQLTSSAHLDHLGITKLGFTQNTSGSSSDSGTPYYMAPEVVAGGVATARSDLFALGVLLYQMVVGDLRRPLFPGWESGVEDPLLREDIALAAHGDAESRLGSARELAQRLARLDERRIERTALEQARATQASLQAQLDRTIARRPWVMATAAALAVGMIVSLVLFANARRAEHEARVQASVAEAVNGFLNRDLLSAADPVRGGSVQITLKDALARASSQLPKRFADQPLVEAEAQQMLGDAYLTFTEFEKSKAAYERAAELYAMALDEGSPRAVAARIAVAHSLARAGRGDEADLLLDAVAQAAEKLNDTHPELLVRLDYARGSAKFYAMNFVGAVEPLKRALDAQLALPAPDISVSLLLRQAYASALSRSARPADALPIAQAAYDELRQTHGDDAVVTLAARHTLARIRITLGQERELIDEYRAMMVQYETLLGADNEHTLLAMQGFAHVLTKTEQWKDAATYSGRVYDAMQARGNASPMHRLVSLNTHAFALMRTGEIEQGVDLLRRELDTFTDKTAAGGIAALATQINLAHGLMDLVRVDDAAPLIERLAGDEGALLRRLDTDAAGEIAYLSGLLARARGDEAKASRELTSAVELLRKKNDDRYWLLALALAAARIDGAATAAAAGS